MMDMAVTEDADIEQLLALRNALMSQLNETEASSSRRTRSGCPFRRAKTGHSTGIESDDGENKRLSSHSSERKTRSKGSDGCNALTAERYDDIRNRIEHGREEGEGAERSVDQRIIGESRKFSKGHTGEEPMEKNKEKTGVKEIRSPRQSEVSLREKTTGNEYLKRICERSASCCEEGIACRTKTVSPSGEKPVEEVNENQFTVAENVTDTVIDGDIKNVKRSAENIEIERPVAKYRRIDERSHSDGDDIVDQPSMFDTFSDSLDFLTKSGSCAATLTNEVEDHSNTPAEKKVEDDGQEGSSRGHTFLPPPPPPPAICDDPSMEANTIIPPPPMPPEQQSLHLSPNETELGEKGPEMSYSIKEGVEDNFISGDECEENIDSLLEKPFRDGQTGKVPMPNEGEMREKTVLAHRGIDYFDVLPEGWVELTHTSGLPVYLHKATRVCTFSRPYFIGPSSVRHHCVPESAIPCLHQRRVLKEVEESAKASADALQNALDASANINGEAGEIDEEKAKLIATLQAPNTKVQTAKDFKERQLDPQALHEYAKGVFRFKTIQVYRFQKWSATRSFHRQKKLAEAERLGKLTPSIEVPVGRPTLPANVQLITVPAMEANLKPQHKGFFLNPQGKTSISILHEYVQKVLKSTISYQFTETRSSSTPYECSARLKMNLNNRVMSAASIKEKLMLLQEKQRREEQLQGNGEPVDSEFVVLGTGCGNSKKTAKLDAAKSALKVLIPAIDFDAEGIAINQKKEGEEAENEREDAVALFDMLPIEDSRIPDLSLRAGQPSPYLLLQECLKRNAAYGDTEIKLSSERVRHQKHQFDMDVGKHRVSVECSNKREGKQKASQAMLKKLHPNLDTWGSLIRLYGHEAQRKQQEAKRSQRSIIKLQGSRDKEGSSMEPNMAILERLCAGMLNIQNAKRRRQEANGGEPVKIRPQLSATNILLNGNEAAEQSASYAASHPDAFSTFRIDL